MQLRRNNRSANRIIGTVILLGAVKSLNTLTIPPPEREGSFDYSTCDGRTLLRLSQAAYIAQWIERPAEIAALHRNFPASEAITDEIKRRTEKNGTNRNFAYFLIGHKTGNGEIEGRAYKELCRIGLGIAYKKRHWRHPDAPQIWVQLVGEVLSKELIRYEPLDTLEVLERLLDNRFAYIWHAFERDFIDELRNLYRARGREKEIPLTPVRPPVDLVKGEAAARDFERKAASLEEEAPGLAEQLRQMARYLRDPEGFESLYGSKLDAAIKKAAAEARDIGIRKAQLDFQKLLERIDVDHELQAIKARLKKSVAESWASISYFRSG